MSEKEELKKANGAIDTFLEELTDILQWCDEQNVTWNISKLIEKFKQERVKIKGEEDLEIILRNLENKKAVIVSIAKEELIKGRLGLIKRSLDLGMREIEAQIRIQ